MKPEVANIAALKSEESTNAGDITKLQTATKDIIDIKYLESD